MDKEKTYSGVIYKYTFPNGKVYIGQTTNPRLRKVQHFSKGSGERNIALWRAIEKYGKDSCTYEEIEQYCESTPERLRGQLNAAEQYYIAFYKADNPKHGYNLTSGGNVFVVNEEGRRHMSEARTDKLPVLQYDLEGNLIAEYESTVEAAKAVESQASNIWNCCKGTASGKRRKKTQVIKGYTFRFKADFPDCPRHIDLSISSAKIPVLRYSEKGEYIDSWDSIIDAAIALGIQESNIRQCIYGKYKSAGHFMWRRRDAFEDIPSLIPARAKDNYHCQVSHEQLVAFSKIAAEKNSKPVLQYSLSGDFIKEYNSLAMAAESVGGSGGTICNACRCKKVKSAYNYQWRYKLGNGIIEGKIEPYHPIPGPIHKKAILQFDKDGNFIKEWNSAREIAIHYGIRVSTVYTAFSDRKVKVKGFVWKYKED